MKKYISILLILSFVFVSFAEDEFAEDDYKRELRVVKYFSISACIASVIMLVLHRRQEADLQALQKSVFKLETKTERMDYVHLKTISDIKRLSLRLSKLENGKEEIVKEFPSPKDIIRDDNVYDF